MPLLDRVLVCSGYEQVARWRDGERLEHLFEDRCDWLRSNGRGDQLAVDAGGVALTYGQLDGWANQLARYLLAVGARPGDRIGLLLDQAVLSYVGMLAVLKINAAYVPLDAGFPTDRLAYITQDAGVRIVLSLSHLRDRLQHVPVTLLCLDEVGAPVAATSNHRLTVAEKGNPVDELCYIIYTSGSTGRPKGVAIEHASICNFVRVAVEVYGLEVRDRIYQGMTIAFDFSVEEIWVPLVAGATLVPKPAGVSLLGHELGEFLQANGVTALCCVPTLLATLDEDLPDLRFLLVSGEACPQRLVARWHRPGRRFLNVYGPTEATVTATWTPVHPDKPVTIGVPLPTYSVVILDPVEQVALGPGELGEIGIAGVGLASGYVNRDDLTARAFVPDFLGIENNPSGWIYRTGDLGRINDDGEIEYHGRVDTQVKIRGYRIELTEIESVLLQVPGVAQAVVSSYEPEPGRVELVAYYSRREDTASVDQERVYDQFRKRLPGYMIPAYLEELAVIPMLPSHKADRQSLPAPKGSRSLAHARRYVPPTTDTERVLADLLAGVLGVERVSTDSHFFEDLGANSLLLAQFCARVRKLPGLPSVSMQDVYLHPTVRSLAVTLADLAAVAALDFAADPADSPTLVPGAEPAPARTPQYIRTAQYIRCGALQVLLFAGYAYLIALLLAADEGWISASTGLVDTYLRSLVAGGATFLGLSAAPILVKWIFVGRWRPQKIPIWSLAYLRFWTVKTLIRANPLVLFVGSPLYVLYLRALGARIGRGVAIFSRNVPVCTDLLTIGDGTVIRKDSFFTCYHAHAGVIQTGRVALGKDVLIGEKTVLDIETSLGDGAQLGHSSALQPTQSVPAGQCWHGSPARRADVDYKTVGPTHCGALRRASYSAFQLLNALVLVGPLGFGVLATLFADVPSLSGLAGSGEPALLSWSFYRDALAVSFVLFFGVVFAALAISVTVPRLLSRVLQPDRTYPLYGFHYAAQRTVARMTNLKFFMTLFGDSSYIVNYLRGLRYDLSQVKQTGSNFGTELRHEVPELAFIGTGTMVSDGLSIMNADFSSTSFQVSQVSIGSHNFLGNNIAYPSTAKTGDNCLLATKVMVPIDGAIRADVGLLGSPCFEIPRSVQRDRRFDGMKSEDNLRAGLAAKNKYNAATIGVFLLVRWIRLFLITVLALAADLYDRFGVWVIAVAIVLGPVLSVAYAVLVERATTRFRPLIPRFCSIYEPYFWWHERLWKLGAAATVFNGTPLKNVIWRLLGVRLGRRVFDAGCGIPEKTLVTIGNDCTLNEGSVIQCHSLEDGTFKSDRTALGDGCTLGIAAFVHYSVTIGDGVVLDADSFVMKGEEIRPHARWRGNPAREVRDVLPGVPARVRTPDHGGYGGPLRVPANVAP